MPQSRSVITFSKREGGMPMPHLLDIQTAAFQTLQSGVWDYLLKLGPRFFRGFSAGQLRARVDAVTRIHQLVSADALRSLLAGAAALPSLALVFWYSPGLGTIVGLCGAIVMGSAWRIYLTLEI